MSGTVEGLDALVSKLNRLGSSELHISAMNKACRVVETAAKKNCTGLFDKPTGTLKASITHEVEIQGKEFEGYVGTNLEYGPYQEFGTGKYAENGDGRKTPWAYTDERTGETIWTAGNKPKPFLRPALTDNRDKVKQILSEGINEVINGG